MDRIRKFLRPVLQEPAKPGRTRTVIVVAATIFTLFGIYSLVERTEWAINLFYSKRLAALDKSIGGIHQVLESSQEIKPGLQAYDRALKQPHDICLQLQKKQRQLGKRKLNRKLHETALRSKKLCDDLVPVLSYSRDLYKSLTPYLIREATSWPTVESGEFSGHLAQTQGLLKRTRANLQKVRHPKVDDPALGELSSQVESAEKVADEAYSAIIGNDMPAASAKTEQLRTMLAQDKADFLNARRYFWNNTVQIDALQEAIHNLRNLPAGK